jgi:hypothetical protein
MESFLKDGWEVNRNGHLVKDDLLIQSRLVQYASGDREVKHHLHDQWIDVLTGLVWPEEAFSEYQPAKCVCGSQHTSLPQMHSEWCHFYSSDQRSKKEL